MATLYENLQGGTITDNPLTSGATTINSSAFQYLPTVSGSDIMYITLDPDGSAGAPEIVKITAHTAAATSVTVARAQQDTTARSHVTGTEWIHGLTEDDVDTIFARLPRAGDLKWTLDTSESGSWINHDQTVVGCDSTYPALWAVAPASWKSGSDLVIPDLADVAMIGAGSVAALGAVGGANTATLTTTELPAHTHTGPSHTHTGPSHTHSGPSHTHTGPSHTHTGPSHSHAFTDGLGVPLIEGGTQITATVTVPDYVSGGFSQIHRKTGGANPAFTSTGGTGATGASGTGATGASGDGLTGASGTGATGASGTDATGSTGSGSAFSIVAASLGVNIQILAY